jgi:DNA-3-methyladenine glycosylase I
MGRMREARESRAGFCHCAVLREKLCRNDNVGMVPERDRHVLERCPWSEGSDAYQAYHDHEWGVPVHDDRVFFEFLILEGAQAGLAWSTILNKRGGYRTAFAGFDPATVATFGDEDVKRLVNDASIVRHRGKIESAIGNACAFLDIQRRFGSFHCYVWRFVGGEPRINRFTTLTAIPTRTVESDALSQDLMRRGFRFVGSTIVYAFMQATGLVNDHLTSCPRWRALGGQPASRARR